MHPLYRNRVLKEGLAFGGCLLVVTVLMGWLPFFAGLFRLVLLILLIAAAVRAIPKMIYCSDCGNTFGRETSPQFPCFKCGGNMYQYQQVGSGHTVKLR